MADPYVDPRRVLVVVCLLGLATCGASAGCSVEYGATSLPVGCRPPSANVARDLRPLASSTCGLRGSERICVASVGGRECLACDDSQVGLGHPATLMTDGLLDTHWRSQTYAAISGGPVNVTLSFNRSFELDSVSVVFAGSPPESFVVLKSSDFGATFVPLHYFSSSCSETYGLAAGLLPEGDSGAVCSADGTASSPSSSGSATFSPLQGRPSASYTEHSAELQDWLHVTDVRLQLDQLTTFGDELAGDPQVLDTYSFAIAELEVNAHCVCNGHASLCTRESGWRCECEHGTEGDSCERCSGFLQDRPWAAASLSQASTCQPCQCYNHSDACVFDEDLYTSSGGQSGGRCLACRSNTAGEHCQRCQEGYQPSTPFTQPEACSALGPSSCPAGMYGFSALLPENCSACSCDENGSEGGAMASCDPSSGQCPCLAGAGGRTCSQCQDGYYRNQSSGRCLPCGCSPGGAVSASCNVSSGQCSCRTGVGGEVDGRTVCDRLLPAFFCPALDHIISEAEQGTLLGRARDIVAGSLYTGTGQLRLTTGDHFTSADIAVPVSGHYQVVFRYATDSASELAYLDFSIAQVGVAQPDPTHFPCDPLSSQVGSVCLLERGSGRAVRAPEPLCLVEGARYQVNISAGRVWGSVLLDSLLLLPDLSALDVFRPPAALQGFLQDGCLAGQLALSSREATLQGQCAQLTCAASLELLDGALACNCSAGGSTGNCSSLGCVCRSGVAGPSCQACLTGYSNYSDAGCRRCDCDPSGVSGDVCANGTCACKSNVEGERCDACVEGSFALRRDRLEGCKACVCSGHASSCMASADTAEVAVSSLQGWTLAPGGGTLTILDAGLELSAAAVPQAVRAPEAWLLPLRQAQDFAMLYFTLGTAPSPNPITPPTIQLAAGSRTFSYTPPPRLSQPSVFTVPILSPNDSSLWLGEGGGTTDATALQRALPSLSSLTLLLPARPCTALLSELRLGLWVRSLTLPLPLPLSPAPLQDQEQCTCPEPYNGLSCQYCAEGYHRDMPVPSPFTDCVPCECNGLSESCDPLSGACLECRDNAAGPTCQACAPGFYRSSSAQPGIGCLPCPCPTSTASFATECVQNGSEVVCASCREGHVGERCEMCADGYYGDPSGILQQGPGQPCSSCDCSGNADPGLLQPCDTVTGECNSCLGNTTGSRCEACSPGFYGDAEIGNCTACPCPAGVACDAGGVCLCPAVASGAACERCVIGSYTNSSGECSACPACFQRVAEEFSATLSLHRQLASLVDVANGSLEEELLRDIEAYRQLLLMLLNQTRGAVTRESPLQQMAVNVSSTAAALEDSIAGFRANVSTAEAETERLRSVVEGQEQQLQLVELQVARLRQLLEGTLALQLRTAIMQHAELQAELSLLIEAAQLANSSSHTLLADARDLLMRSNAALVDAKDALAMICSAISLQNSTWDLLAELLAGRAPALEALFTAASEALQAAEAEVPSALQRSEDVLQRVLSLFPVLDFNSTALVAQLGQLQASLGTLHNDTQTANQEVAVISADAAELMERAEALLIESMQLNTVATDLLTRAHAALEYANTSVQMGNDIISEGQEILLRLRERLASVANLSSGLAQVLQELNTTEQLSSSALNAASRDAAELALAMAILQNTTILLDIVNTKLFAVTEMATQANATANSTVQGAIDLTTGSAALSANVSITSSSLTSLEQQSAIDGQAISVANRTAGEVVSNASALLQRIAVLNGSVAQLRQALDAEGLVAKERLSEISTIVFMLEAETDSNEVIVADVRDRIETLERSAEQLRSRYRALQQHRAVLEGILTNVESLNCRDQFQRP